jgi:hypothetical protein
MHTDKKIQTLKLSNSLSASLSRCFAFVSSSLLITFTDIRYSLRRLCSWTIAFNVFSLSSKNCFFFSLVFFACILFLSRLNIDIISCNLNMLLFYYITNRFFSLSCGSYLPVLLIRLEGADARTSVL